MGLDLVLQIFLDFAWIQTVNRFKIYDQDLIWTELIVNICSICVD